MQPAYEEGYTEEVTEGFAGVGGAEVGCVLKSTEIILYDIAIYMPNSTEATRYSVGTSTAAVDLVNNAYYQASSIAYFNNFDGKGKKLTLAAAKKLFANISITEDYKINIHYGYKP